MTLAPAAAICAKPLLAERLRSILKPSSLSELSVQVSPISLSDRADATSPDGAAGGVGSSGMTSAVSRFDQVDDPTAFWARTT